MYDPCAVRILMVSLLMEDCRGCFQVISKDCSILCKSTLLSTASNVSNISRTACSCNNFIVLSWSHDSHPTGEGDCCGVSLNPWNWISSPSTILCLVPLDWCGRPSWSVDRCTPPLNCTSTYYMFCTFDVKIKNVYDALSWFMFDLLTVSRSVHYAWFCYQYIMNTCPICKRRTQRHSRTILCHSCKADIHYNCSGLLLDDFESALSDGNWFCRLCVEGFFPFNHFYEDNDFLNVLKNYQNLLILQLDCTIVPKYLTLLTSMKMTTISLNIMVI